MLTHWQGCRVYRNICSHVSHRETSLSVSMYALIAYDRVVCVNTDTALTTFSFVLASSMLQRCQLGGFPGNTAQSRNLTCTYVLRLSEAMHWRPGGCWILRCQKALIPWQLCVCICALIIWCVVDAWHWVRLAGIPGRCFICAYEIATGAAHW